MLGLSAARRKLPGLNEAEQIYLADRYRLPQPRLALGALLRELATAALDISDGLVADLGHLAAASGVALRVEAAAVPVSPAASAVLDAGNATLAELLTGGDDYELAFTAAEASWGRLIAAGATRIGMVGQGAGVHVSAADGTPLVLERAGYRHF